MRGSGTAWLAAVSMLAAACAFDRTGSSGGDGGGVDPADAGVAIDGGSRPDALDPGCTERCEGATLVDCPGGTERRTMCDIGCTEAGGPHCGELVPSNGVDPAAVDGVTGELRVMGSTTATIEADTGRITAGPVELRAAGEGDDHGIRYLAGPPYNVFVFDRLEVGGNATLLIRAPYSTGGVTSPIVLVVGNDVEINGLIDVTAGCIDGTHWCAGVGGGNGGTTTYVPLGCAVGGAGDSVTLHEDTGGGGGGLGQNGAAGGNSSDLFGGAGGDIAGCPGPSLVPLSGGSGGDMGGAGGSGGGGGGGLQITAFGRIRVRAVGGGGVTPGIWAGGGGGTGGGIGGGGGGGGAGGAILLEAPRVELGAGAILAANGGGGGEGDGSGLGQDGLLASAPAGGGGGVVVRHGGDGGYAVTLPEPGDGPGDGTGGGGGGAGIIRVNSADAALLGTASPPATTGPLAVQ